MKIKLAEIAELETVFQITQKTIRQVYPNDYPAGAVAFFQEYHTNSKIAADIKNQSVFLIEEQQNFVGTMTINQNEIGRLFVLPDYQNRGIGSFLMNFRETLIFEKYDYVSLDSSLPGKKMYIKRGYKVIKSCSLVTNNGDILCYDEMVKMKDRNQ